MKIKILFYFLECDITQKKKFDKNNLCMIEI